MARRLAVDRGAYRVKLHDVGGNKLLVSAHRAKLRTLVCGRLHSAIPDPIVTGA